MWFWQRFTHDRLNIQKKISKNQKIWFYQNLANRTKNGCQNLVNGTKIVHWNWLAEQFCGAKDSILIQTPLNKFAILYCNRKQVVLSSTRCFDFDCLIFNFDWFFFCFLLYPYYLFTVNILIENELLMFFKWPFLLLSSVSILFIYSNSFN